jgi:hypothetical protein
MLSWAAIKWTLWFARYIHENLSYRFVTLADGKAARATSSWWNGGTFSRAAACEAKASRSSSGAGAKPPSSTARTGTDAGISGGEPRSLGKPRNLSNRRRSPG